MTCRFLTFPLQRDWKKPNTSKGHRCSHQFCWRCLNPYEGILTEGNLGHKESCPYSSDLLPSNALLDPEGYLDEEGNVRILTDPDDEVDMLEEWGGIQEDEEHNRDDESILVREEDQEGVAAALTQQLLQTQREEAIINEQERQGIERREGRRAARTQRRRMRRREARMRQEGRE